MVLRSLLQETEKEPVSACEHFFEGRSGRVAEIIKRYVSYVNAQRQEGYKHCLKEWDQFLELLKLCAD